MEQMCRDVGPRSNRIWAHRLRLSPGSPWADVLKVRGAVGQGIVSFPGFNKMHLLIPGVCV